MHMSAILFTYAGPEHLVQVSVEYVNRIGGHPVEIEAAHRPTLSQPTRLFHVPPTIVAGFPRNGFHGQRIIIIFITRPSRSRRPANGWMDMDAGGDYIIIPVQSVTAMPIIMSSLCRQRPPRRQGPALWCLG